MNKNTEVNILLLIGRVFGRIVLIGILMSFLQLFVFSQIKESIEKPQIIKDDSNIPSIEPTNCESLQVALEGEVFNNKKINKNSAFIIIFRLNEKDNDKYYLSRRRTLETWFKTYSRNKYVFAQSDSINDIGRADIYINGEKSFIIYFKAKTPNLCLK